MYQYLKPDNLVEVFETSKQYTEGLTDKFQEYERIAANKPHASVPKEYPKTTDGTTASIIRKTPHRIIQQLPTGKVISIEEDWLSVVADFIYRKKIIPTANKDYALIQKCWQVVERFQAFGHCSTYTPFLDHNGYLCTDLTLPYWADTFLQPGKLSDSDSQYIFLRSWWQTNDIEALIASQSKIDKDKRTWDLEALRRVKKQVTTKDNKAKTPKERESQINAEGGVELITGFQRGIKSKFYTFHVSSGEIVRVKENKHPSGDIPVIFAYGDIDGSSPLGRSVVELVSGIQNLIDAETQMYQYNRALQLNPPLIKRGTFSKNRIKFAPNAIIDIGSSTDASLEPLKIDTTALQNFPQNFGLMKSQLLNLLSSPDTSISADSGNPGFSKTPQGVEASRANLNVDDNYYRRQFETWFEKWSEMAINLYFAEREGIEELELDDDTVEELLELADKGKFDASLLNENKIRINYSTATQELKFEVDASTSRLEDQAKQLASLSGLEDLLRKSELLQNIIPLEKQIGLWNAFVKNSGVNDSEELSLTKDEIAKAQETMASQSQNKDDIYDQIHTNYKDAPEDIKRQIEAKNGFEPSQMMSPSQQQVEQKAIDSTIKLAQAEQPQPNISPADRQFIEQLQQMGIDEQRIGQSLAMLHAGKEPAEIIQVIGV